MKDDRDVLDAFELGGVLSNVHPDVLGEDGRAERGCEVVFDEQFTIIFDTDLVDQMHLSYGKANLGIDHLLKFFRDFFYRDQDTLPEVSGSLDLYALRTRRITLDAPP